MSAPLRRPTSSLRSNNNDTIENRGDNMAGSTRDPRQNRFHPWPEGWTTLFWPMYTPVPRTPHFKSLCHLWFSEIRDVFPRHSAIVSCELRVGSVRDLSRNSKRDLHQPFFPFLIFPSSILLLGTSLVRLLDLGRDTKIEISNFFLSYYS